MTIKKPNLLNTKLANISLSASCKQILLGSILGDGMLKIYKGYKNARFTTRHSIIQEAYCLWKAEKLKEIASSKSIQYQKPDGFSQNCKLSFQSRALQELTQIYDEAYKNNKLVIKRKWLNYLTPLALCIWWLDDGSIVCHGRRGVLSTEGFDKESVELLARYLLKVWGIEAHVGPHKVEWKGQTTVKYRLWFNSTNTQKFLKLILPCFPNVPNMVYKLVLTYNDPQLQQSWVSELKNALPHLSNNIDQALAIKKQ